MSTQYSTRVPDDDTAMNYQRENVAVAIALGGVLSASLTDGGGQAWLLVDLPDGKDPNMLLAPLPAPATWQPRDLVVS